MNMTAAIMIAAGALLTIWAVKNINPGTFLLSALLGLGAMFAADLILGFTYLNLPVNWATLLCAITGGIPGVILIVILNAMLTI